MARKTHLLDDIQIRHWIAKGEPVAKSDGEGLTFTLSSAGTASWILRYRRGGGRRKEITIGNYPDMTLAAARKAARAHRVAVDNGIDPAAEKKVEKARSVLAWTVNELCDDYEEKHLVAPLSKSTIYYRKWDIKNIIRPKLGSLEVRKILPADIVYILENSGRTWTVNKRILTSMKQLFGHALGKRIIDVNPAFGIEMKALFGKRPPVRKRLMLTEGELRKLLPGIDKKIGRENGLMLRVLLATCVRTNELVMARKQFIDLKRGSWFVHDESVKTRQGFTVPLVPVVIGWMKELYALSGDSDWLLPARSNKRRNRLGETHIGNTTLWAAITRAFQSEKLEMRRFTPHDTRSTAKSHMRNLGISNEVSELALNHKLKGMEGIYDVREEIPERREAMEIWAQFIADCCDGKEPETGRPTNVVALRRKAAA
jgi:integrase